LEEKVKNEYILKLFTDFEESKYEKENSEFWFAREIQEKLGYTRWENFEKVINKAKNACKNSGQKIENHFLDVTKMVKIGSGAEKPVIDLMLTRYASYLIAQNGDPRKEEIAFAQTYFAIQTRKQEILEEKINERERLYARKKLSETEKELSGLLYERCIEEQGFARIRSKGDFILFGGKSTLDMKIKLGVPDKRALADFLPTITIKAKDFATEITNFNIRKEELKNEIEITQEHISSNQEVRRTLTNRGIYPESLPAEEDIKKVERRIKNEGRQLLKIPKQLKK
jgi:DNA-damage-inducible protein D